MMKKEFAVIGLGRFGGSIVRELMSQGAQVMAIDHSSERVDEFASIATQAVIYVKKLCLMLIISVINIKMN